MYARNYPYGYNGCTPTTVALSGVVTNNGVPVSGIVIDYTVNGYHRTTTTNGGGQYTIMVPYGANVTIHAVQPGVGVTVTPPLYTICHASQSQGGYNFTLTPVVQEVITVMGRVQGLPQQSGVQILCCINGQQYTFMTDAYGYYRFSVPYGASLKVHPIDRYGYTVYPSDLYYEHVYASLVLPTCTYAPMRCI